jgi:large subunit ribosomal protein L6
MSRIANRPIAIASGVTVNYQDRQLSVKGPKGELQMNVHEQVDLDMDGDTIQVKAAGAFLRKVPMLGTTHALIRNMLEGVTNGYRKQLNLVGVGYRAAVNNNVLEMSLGFSHPVNYPLPDGVTASIAVNTKITLESIDKQLIGQVSAEIRKFRPPEPYKGKGILFEGERVRRKAGKSGKK